MQTTMVVKLITGPKAMPSIQAIQNGVLRESEIHMPYSPPAEIMMACSNGLNLDTVHSATQRFTWTMRATVLNIRIAVCQESQLKRDLLRQTASLRDYEHTHHDPITLRLQRSPTRRSSSRKHHESRPGATAQAGRLHTGKTAHKASSHTSQLPSPSTPLLPPLLIINPFINN